jgi:CubicO group peptidase (beta-lactamase class C family)
VENYTPTLDVKDAVPKVCKVPLLFEPGTSWEYSVGIDWAGKMVERVSGLDLETYFKKNIWGPLGVESITFHPQGHPTTLQRLTDMSLRQGGISPMGAAINPEAPVEYSSDRVFSLDAPDCFGGAGLYGNVIDYQKLLQSICADDGKLLKKETVDYMFQDHLSAASKAELNNRLKIPEIRDVFGGVPGGMEITYGLGGMIYLKDVEGGRRAGSMAWGGYPNLVWFVDRKAGVNGIAGTQICPPGDPKNNSLVHLFEKELYKSVGKEKL